MTKSKRILIVTITMGIFVLDVYTPLGTSPWLLYLIPALYVSLRGTRGEIIFLNTLFSALTAAAFFLSPPGFQPVFSVLKRSLWIAALWIVSFLNLRHRELEADLSAANRQIRESEENLRTVFDSSYDGIFVHDLDGKIIDVNNRVLEMYGIDYRQALSLSIPDLSAPDNPLDLAADFWRKAAAGDRQLFEWKAKRPRDGSFFEVEVSLTRISLKKRDAVLATVRDITERKQTEEALKLTRFSVDNASVCAYLVSRDARLLYVNEQTCRTLGYSREELLSMAVYDLDPDFPLAVWDDHWANLKREGRLHFETTQRRKDGTLVPIELSLNFLAFRGREYNVAFGQDISERKRSAQEIARINRRNELVLKSAGEGILGLDAQGNVTFINRAAADMLGYEEQELIGRHGHELWHYNRPDGTPYPAGECPIYKAYSDGATHAGEELFWRRDGSGFPIDYTSMPFRENGLSGAVVTFRDITERKQAELALIEAYADLEEKIRERTRELAEANSELRLEIIERHKIEERIRRSKELSDGLNRLSGVIHSTLDLDLIMERVVEESARTMKVDAAMIGSFEGDAFRVRYTCNMPEAFTGRRFRTNELRAIQHATVARDALAFNDALNDERLNMEFVREVGIRSLLVAPLLLKEKVAGALAFYGLDRQIFFDEEQIDFARKLAASVSLALENARLYQSLAESESLSSSRFVQLKTIYDTAPIGLCFLDREFRYLSINERLAQINQIPVEKTLGRTVREVLPDIAGHVEGFCRRAMETGIPVEDVEITDESKLNRNVTVSSSYYPVRDKNSGEIIGFSIVVQDITERKRMENALQASERRLRAIVNSIPDIAWLKDSESRFIMVNEAFGAAAGKKPAELIGKTDFDAWPAELAENYRADDREVMIRRERKRVEEPLSSGGNLIWIDTIKTPIYDEKGEVIGTAGIARDITERRRMEEEIRHMAQHDVLTGLPNRRLLLDIITLGVAEARRHRNKLGILFLDLDRFKEVNDTLGHEAGDELLKSVAERLKNVVRESDTVARLGGDEFNILLTDLTRVEDATSIIQKIIDCFQVPFLITGHELHVTTSIGVSIYPDDSEDIESLFRYADIALYHAKELGKNTHQFYNPAINIRSLERMKLASYLRQALKREELVVHYQPQVDIRTGKILCAEALVRWNHPENGLLPPKRFIPLAEETGFIAEIDEWVLRTVCAQVKSWLDAGLPPLCITVNLSAREFQNPELVGTIGQILDETGLRPECLDIELTESTAMHDIDRAIARLRQLADLGVGIAIDDFGTGYSSLNYLKRMPIQKLKIDRSFVKDIASDPDDRAIIRAVTAMAHNMKMRVVAEGVETADQLSFLHETDCDEAQGYLFSRPLPAEKFEELIAGAR